jgi:RNA polymerase sigma-70 factor (ECF subfamily)
MKAIAKPDPTSWVDDYGDDLYRYAVFRVRNPETAEELVQETFLAGLKARESFSGRSSVKTWLFGILKHKIIDTFRRKDREKPLSAFDGDEAEGADEGFFDRSGHWNRPLQEWGEDPGVLARNREFREVLARCVADLPERLQRAFVLRELEDLERDEIRKILDVTATNFGVMLHRARVRVRACLESNWFAGKGERTP